QTGPPGRQRNRLAPAWGLNRRKCRKKKEKIWRELPKKIPPKKTSISNRQFHPIIVMALSPAGYQPTQTPQPQGFRAYLSAIHDRPFSRSRIAWCVDLFRKDFQRLGNH